ncbi:excinuclease ABC subunit UvrB [Patescibacteria group bacterium]|nr:excinuclease ABC subunit UvrB [Patescibacteria group bacterium]
MNKFKLKAPYQPAGDQPKAIEQLMAGLDSGKKFQTLLGVTGSGKTYTMANVIAKSNRPTLVIAHNKTLAAQLCNEFREFFPDHAVEYFVSYYDYYQPEAYMPRSDTYIEKEAQINDEIDRLRHAATQAILTRRDVIIVASVSCIYALGSPEEYKATVLHLQVGEGNRADILHTLVKLQFERTNADLTRGHYRVRGDVLEIMPVDHEIIYRVTFADDAVAKIDQMDPITRKKLEEYQDAWLFPATHFVVSPAKQQQALREIKRELEQQLKKMDKEGKVLEAERLKRRTRYDLEMIQNIGYCNGIENYSRYFDGRAPGQPPYSLMDFFPKDYLLIIDESHVTVPQIGGMYEGDRARKETLVEHGFRLPSAKDNRPLKFEEFEERVNQVIFTTATPGKYELKNSEQVVEQIIRPTGLIDPEVVVRPVSGDDKQKGQVDDLIEEIVTRAKKNERSLVTTLTKRMAEDLTEFLKERDIKVQYLHSDVQTLDRITILSDFRQGKYDCLVGVNLLREGLDLPEVTLVAILDADKEGFLRSATSLIQTIGRAARNVAGKVILYADNMTGSLGQALKETNRRRKIQLAHNQKHRITPKSIKKEIHDIRGLLGGEEIPDIKDILKLELTAEPHEIKEVIAEKEYDMKEAAKKLDFETAAILRDEIRLLNNELKGRQ